MMTRRMRREGDEVKMSVHIPKALAKSMRLRALKDGVPLRTIFLRALTAYVRPRRKEKG